MNITRFVFPYIIPNSPVFGWELMYSIRSIYKNYKDPFTITIIGEIPNWINTSEVKCIQFDNNHYGKRVAARTNQKLLLAADAYSDVYDNILWMNDDVYLVNECSLDDFKVPRYISDKLKYTDSKKGLNTFKKLMRYTWFQLKELGKPNNFNYANHCPIYYESKRLKELNDVFNLTACGDYTSLATLAYHNYFEIEGKPMDDFRVGYWGESEVKIKKTTKILNHDDKGFFSNPWILSYLNASFPRKCPAEI